MREKIVGIIGGMGPEATIDLMTRVIRATPALDDMDHIRIVVDNNSKVPSRIKALIEKTGESPLSCLQEMARKLADWGVDVLAIPCNTAHYYHPGIQETVGIPVLDMIGLSVAAIITGHPGLKTVGILASSAVIDLQIYEKRFAEKGVALVTPAGGLQKGIMDAIRKIKTGRFGKKVHGALQAAATDLVDKGAEALLVACTELSIIASEIDVPIPVYDSAQVLAEAIVKTVKETG